jgi:hypothetical protein
LVPNPVGIPEPTEALALEAFERVLGADAQRVWDQARAEVGHAGKGAPLTPAELREVAEHLSKQEGFVGVLGTSLRLRIDTYTTLSSVWGTPLPSDPDD